MKKTFLVILVAVVLASCTSAQVLIGSRNSGMGGSGAANSTDLSAVYYNPAGLMRAADFGLQLSLGPTYTDYQKVADAFSKAADISTFLQDNFAKELSFSGDVAALFGISFNKIGISAIALPLGTYTADTLSGSNSIYLSKGAGSLQASMAYSIRYDAILTLGRSFELLTLPVDAGVNLKYISAAYGTFNAAALASSTPYTKAAGTGSAADVGLQTTVEMPLLGSTAVGVAMRDIGGQITYKRKQETYYFNNLTGIVTKGAESDLANGSVTLDSNTVIGLAGTFSPLNLGLAADVEMRKNETIVHLGLEYPLLKDFLIVRAGTISSPSIAKTTVGAKLTLLFLTVDATSVIDRNNSSILGWVADIGLGI